MTLQVVKTTETAKSNAVDLELLGIDAAKKPTGARYPKLYNPKCHKIWQKVIEELSQEEKDTQQLWMTSIRKFLKECKDKELDPFDKNLAEKTNASIESWLASNRVKAVDYCNKIQLFKNMAIKSVKRTAEVNEKNFTVHSQAITKVLVDPTLGSWLSTNPIPGFALRESGCYEEQINAATTVKINFIGNYAEINLSIFCHSIPNILNAKSSVSRAKLAKHIEKSIWTSLIKKYKFNGTQNKLF